MKKMKITALILSLSIIFSLISFQTVYADEFNDPFRTEIDFLKIIDLVEQDYDATLVITKGEFLMTLLSALYPDVDFSTATEGEAVFRDVPYEHMYYPYIKASKDMGIIRGNGTADFYPDNQVTLAETITMIVNSLGYTYHADAFGGYPTGYYTVAKQIGLLKNIDLVMSDAVDGGNAVRLIYNALFANIVEMVSISNGSMELKVNEKKNILSERFSVFEYDGIITDNGIVTLEGGTGISDDRAVIKNASTGEILKAYINDTDVANYFGQRVKAYIRNNIEEGRYEFVYVTPHDKAKVLTINVDDVVYADNSYVEYTEDEFAIDTKKAKLPLTRPVVIFNGIKIIDRTVSELIPQDGFIKFVDNYGSGSYDLVIIYSFNYSGGSYTGDARNIVVDHIVTTEGEEGIACSFNPVASVDLEEENYIYSFILNENIRTLNEIKSGQIVSIAEAPEQINGKTYYMLAVSDNTFSGTLESVETPGRLWFSGGEYSDISSSITSVKTNFVNNLKIGSEMEVMFDVTGKAAYIKTSEDGTKNYAYIVKAMKKSQGDEYVQVKFFSKDGKMYSLPLASNATVDGVRVSGLSMDDRVNRIKNRPFEGVSQTGRPAIIKVSNDQIVSIDTDTPNIDISGGVLSEIYEQQSRIQYTVEEAESYDALKAGFRSPRATTVRGTSKTVGGKFFITSGSVILNVPEIDTYAFSTLNDYRPYGYSSGYFGGTEYQPDAGMISLYENDNTDENYKILPLSQMYSTYSFDIQGYDIDPDTGIAGLVVLRGKTDMYRPSNVPAATVMSVFEKTTEVYDEAEEKTLTRVYYYENGESKSATIDLETCYYPYKALIRGCAAGDTPHNVAVTALSKGDVIRVIQTGGKITHIERVRRLRAMRSDEIFGFVPFAKGVSVPYSASVKGIDSAFPYDMPIIDTTDTTDTYSVENSNVVLTAHPIKLKGNVLQLACTREYEQKFNTINFSVPTSYTKHYFNTGKMDITVIEIGENGTDIKMRKGSFDDIITMEEESDISRTSLIMSRITSSELTETYVINGLNNLR